VIPLVLSGVAAYLIGCLVGAYYIVRLRRGRDVRDSGSGNAGARNVFRSGDRSSALLTLLWDMLKGAIALGLSRAIAGSDAAAGFACVAVVAGHVWPAQLQFRGGKGVATAIGCLLALGPRALLGGSGPLVTGAVAAITIVVIVHHPALNRCRRARSAQPTQEIAS
jgi:glycerol-3-phosphate acyltransferase PlsY